MYISVFVSVEQILIFKFFECTLTSLHRLYILVSMPQVFVYIRNSDIDKWKAVEKKSLFIHNALNQPAFTERRLKDMMKPLKDIPESPQEVFVPKPPDPKTGYSCCTRKTPCKHWQWDSSQESYINTLAGIIREPDIL